MLVVVFMANVILLHLLMKEMRGRKDEFCVKGVWVSRHILYPHQHYYLR